MPGRQHESRISCDEVEQAIKDTSSAKKKSGWTCSGMALFEAIGVQHTLLGVL